MLRLHYLTMDDVDEIATRAALRYRDTRAFKIHGEDGMRLLDSALAQPRSPHHRTLPCKAATLHCFLVRNHPFLDGNKCFAQVANGELARESACNWVAQRTARTSPERTRRIKCPSADDQLPEPSETENDRRGVSLGAAAMVDWR